MTLNIDITPREAAWLAAKAAERGLQPSEIVKQLIDAQLPAEDIDDRTSTAINDVDPTAALFASWAIEDAQPGISTKTQETLAWLDSQLDEARNADSEATLKVNLEVEELRSGLNANRTVLGERQI